MIFEIINPSDKYTIESDSWETAAVATLMIGEGQYALDGCDNEHRMGLFLFGGADKFLMDEFGIDINKFSEYVHAHKKELADCLDTVMIGGKSDRESYKKGLELIKDADARKEWRDHWHDQRRSSMNNIGAYAWQMAERLRAM